MPCMQQGLPALEHLGISHKGQYRCSYSHLCVGRALLPRLRSLCYTTQSMVLGCADDQLRHLDIFGCACESCGKPVYTPPLNELLAGYLRLETLTLHYTILNTLFQYETLRLPSEDAPPIALPVLRKLTIKTGQPIPPACFPRLVFPETCLLHLVCPAWYQGPLRNLIRDPLRSISQVVNAHVLCISRNPWGFVTFRASIAHSECLQLEIWAASMDAALFKFGKSLCPHMPQVTTLTIDDHSRPDNVHGSDHAPMPGLQCLLAALPSLRRLHIGRVDSGDSQALHILNEGFPAGGDYLCAHFEQMSIVWSLHDDEQRDTGLPAP
ncbi:hypothetical protein OH76DRAFT_133299 [Lentinus brumalis]|uniref:Uncharacterized protein n=1 Tax=Lentinus brumalis TaxID=2498619 RepID=A0A371DK38_9APHY|nr:hypothetical protein OH76DRAFT_133299 [Polyporus brumalis]